MKNIFLGVIVLFVLVVPNFAKADYDYGKTHENKLKEAGWTDAQIRKLDQNVNNLSSGSTYTRTFRGKVYSDNLYKSDPIATGLEGTEMVGLLAKLREGGSTVDQSKLKSNPYDDFPENNVYRINDGNTTNYIYDPTPYDGTNNDQVVLATATKEGLFLTYKNPVAKEVSERNRDQNMNTRDTDSLDGVLNANDIVNNRPSGSTVYNKNLIANLETDQAKLMQDKFNADAEIEELQKQLETANASEIPAIQRAMAEAIARSNNASSSLANINGSLSNAYMAQYQASYGVRVPPQTPESCKSTINNPAGPFSSFYCILTFVSMGTNIIFKLTSFFAYITGTLFDYSLEFSINSAEFFKKLGVVEITWSFIRDILNMTFIFILLWTALQILIGNEAKYNAQKMLRNVIIVAILINFSLFAAKLMVDTSNVVSLKIYEAMKANTSTEATRGASISTRVMNTVGLTQLYNISEIFNTASVQAEGQCASNPGALITVSVMGSIFLIILCLALGLAAILFLVRLVNIIFLFIKSPIWVWAHVIPGNPTMEKLKKDWESSMMHVIKFPILYLFWMLVAVIVFEKLGQVKTVAADGSAVGGVSLLNLICNNPGSVGIGQSISLVAIFGIVIIFMMKAIEYGFKHAGDGGSDTVGSKFSSSMANKFSGYQKAMTSGLAKKAQAGVVATGSAVAGVGIGAANRGITLAKDTTNRASGAVVGGINSLYKKDKAWTGIKDGFLNPEIARKEVLRDLAKKAVLKTQGGVLDTLGLTGAAAKLAEKHKEPTNKAGETKKKADERRSANAVADEKRQAAIIEEAYKVATYKDWKKDNASGTFDDYKTYAEEKIKGRLDRLYGEGVASTAAANGQTHIENISKSSVVEYEEDKRDANGNIELDSAGKAIKEKKIRFDEAAMRSAVQKMAKDDTVKEKIKSGKHKGILLRNIRAGARVKALETHESEQKGKSEKRTRNEEKTIELERDIPDLKQEISKMPQPENVEEAVKTRQNIVPVSGYKGKKLREVNLAINKFKAEQAKPAGQRDTVKIDEAREAMTTKYEEYSEYFKKVQKDLAKKEEELSDHLAKIEEEKNK